MVGIFGNIIPAYQLELDRETSCRISPFYGLIGLVQTEEEDVLGSIKQQSYLTTYSVLFCA